MSKLFDNISSALAPLEKQTVGEGIDRQAAVLFLLQETEQGLFLLLTQRSQKLTHHPGEVAFPGGMWEPQDDHFPVDTALRESFEEVNLPATAVEVLGQLPITWSRTGTQVTPVVARLKHAVELRACIDETEAFFWLPLNHLRDDPRERTDVFARDNRQYWVPVYRYEGYEIWGLTASVIVNFLRQCFALTFDREHSAPEKHWR